VVLSSNGISVTAASNATFAVCKMLEMDLAKFTWMDVRDKANGVGLVNRDGDSAVDGSEPVFR